MSQLPALKLDVHECLPDYGAASIYALARQFAAWCDVPGLDADAGPLPAWAPREARNLVLWIVDGLGAAALERFGAGSTIARHRAGELSSVLPSTTAAAMTTYYSALSPAQHGATGWHMRVAGVDGVIQSLPLQARAPAPEGAQRERYAAAQVYSHANVCALMKRETVALLPAYIAHSPYSVFHTEPARRVGFHDYAELLDALAAALHAPGAPRVVTVYDPELDATSHAHGPDGDAAQAAFAAADAAFARALELAAGSDALFVLSADHGFIATPPERHLVLDQLPALAAMLAGPLCGEPRLAWCDVRPECLAEFDAYVSRHLAHATRSVPSAELLAHGLLGPGPAHPDLATRVGNRALVMRENWLIRDWLPGEKHYPLEGSHGGISRAEMRVPLVVAHAR